MILRFFIGSTDFYHPISGCDSSFWAAVASPSFRSSLVFIFGKVLSTLEMDQVLQRQIRQSFDSVQPRPPWPLLQPSRPVLLEQNQPLRQSNRIKQRSGSSRKIIESNNVHPQIAVVFQSSLSCSFGELRRFGCGHRLCFGRLFWHLTTGKDGRRRPSFVKEKHSVYSCLIYFLNMSEPFWILLVSNSRTLPRQKVLIKALSIGSFWLLWPSPLTGSWGSREQVVCGKFTAWHHMPDFQENKYEAVA